MADVSLPDFKINTNEPEKGVRQLLGLAKPSWNSDKIHIQALSGGFSSKIFRAWDENDPLNVVTIRIRCQTEMVGEFLNHFEQTAIQHISKMGRFPKVNAVFDNGYCYNFIRGKPVIDLKHKTGTITDIMLIAIAKEMANIHNVDISPLAEYNEKSYFTKLLKSFSTCSFEHDSIPSKEIFTKEILFIDEFRKQINSPVGLCHGDSHGGNFVWNEEEQKITFVDWEMTCVDYQYDDIAYFIESIDFIDLENISSESFVKPHDFKSKFLTAYFQELCKLRKQKYSENEFSHFENSIHKFLLVPLLGRALFAAVFPEPTAEMAGNLNLYFEKCMEKYFKHKKDVLGKTGYEGLLE